jgi:hypothetical protein
VLSSFKPATQRKTTQNRTKAMYNATQHKTEQKQCTKAMQQHNTITNRHVVVSLHGAAKGSFVVPRRRNDLVEGGFQVNPNVRIGGFVDDQTRGGVLDKEVAHADIDLRQVHGDDFLDFRRDKVAAP